MDWLCRPHDEGHEVNEPILLLDGTKILADALSRFAQAISERRFADAERYAELAFYLYRNRVAGTVVAHPEDDHLRPVRAHHDVGGLV
jgi:hypothetical protein